MRFLYYALFVLLALPVRAQYATDLYRRGYENRDSLHRNGLTEIYFVGTGDLQFGYPDKSAANEGIAANTGLGVWFWRIWRGRRES